MAKSLVDFNWRKPRALEDCWEINRKLTGPIYYHRPRLHRQPEPPELPGQWGLAYHPFGIRVLNGPQGKTVGPTFVVCHSRDLVTYRPLEAFASLFRQFANLRTATDVLRFIQHFGPLTREGYSSRLGELIEGVLANAEAMREFLLDQSGGKDHLAFVDAAQVYPFAELAVTLAFDPEDSSPALKFAPSSLLDALWLQAVQSLGHHVVIRECPYCGQLFEAGIGTKRRLDAKFCCDEHKIAYHSLKRSRG